MHTLFPHPPRATLRVVLLAACVALSALPGVAQAQTPPNLHVAGGGGGGGGTSANGSQMSGGAGGDRAGGGGKSGMGDGSAPGGGGGGGGAYVGASDCNFSCDGAKGADASAGGAGGAGGTGGGAGGGIKGADGSSGGAGGAGGAAVATIASGSYNNVIVAGGDGGYSATSGGSGGAGGSATLNVSGSLTANYLSVRSGTPDTASATRGAGGAASLKVNELDVTGNNTLLRVDGTAADDAHFTTVRLGGTLTVSTNSTGEAKIDTLLLAGVGRLTDPYPRLSIGQLASDGGRLYDDNWGEFVNRSYTDTDDIRLDGALTIDVSGNQALWRKLTGPGKLVTREGGAGVFTLWNAGNDYQGGTQVQSGQLELAHPNATGTGDVDLASGSLWLECSGDYDNKITGAGGVRTKGTLTLRNAGNSYSGGTVVAGGTLILPNPAAAGTGNVGVHSGTLRLTGSGAFAGALADVFGFNTLEVQAAGISAANVKGFETINFTLPASIGAGDKVLSVTGSGASSFPNPTNVNLAFTGTPRLNVDDEIILIDASNLSITPTPTSVTIGAYEFEVKQNGNRLIAKVLKAPPPPPGSTATAVPTLGGVELALTSMVLAGAAVPALRRRRKQAKRA